MGNEKYTQKVMEAFQSAQQIAALHYNQEISSVHMLMGLLKEPEGLLSTILTECQTDVPMLQARLEQLLKKANELDVPLGDVLATATRFTAECISAGVRDYCPVKPDRMIVGGGGSMNPTLLAHIADCLPGCEVMTNEQLGLDSNAKEAVAFAVLANEAMYGQPNNAPGATGAAHPVVMGKISQ